MLLCFEISCNSKFFDRWPWKLWKWPWFLANVAVNAYQDLATLNTCRPCRYGSRQVTCRTGTAGIEQGGGLRWGGQYTLYSTAEESARLFHKTKWRISVVSECCWELRCCPRQPPPVIEPWLHTDCWRGFKPLVPSDKRFNHSKVWCTFISSST